MRRKSIKGGILLTSGQVASVSVIFLRNVLVARLIGPHEFGIGATFVLTSSLLEMMSNVGAENLLVTAEDGEDVRLQGTAHTLQLLRGLFGAAVLALLAGPISSLFGVPDARWAYLCLALVPLLGAFRHMDPTRFHREMRYGPDIIVELSHQIIGLIVSVLMAWYLESYWAVLWGLVAQWATMSFTSWFVAERPYGYAFDCVSAKRIGRFGWPLLANGLVMFAILQGDRVVIGSQFPMSDLGIYSVAFGLTWIPTMLISRVMSALVLPQLAQARERRDTFLNRYEVAADGAAVVGAMIVVGATIAGGAIVRLLYGMKFAPAETYLPILAAAQAMWVMRLAPALAELSKGDTRSCLFVNVVRASGVGMSLAAAIVFRDLIWVAFATFVADALALATSTALTYWCHHLPVKKTVKRVCVAAAFVALAFMIDSSVKGTQDAIRIGIGTAASVLAGLIFAMILPGCRRELLKMGSQLRRMFAMQFDILQN